MRWLSLPLVCDVDAISARARLRAWSDALGASPAAQVQLVSLGSSIVSQAAQTGAGAIAFGWDDRGQPFCEIDQPDGPSALATAEAARVAGVAEGARGLELEIGVERGRARVRLATDASAPRSEVERALSRVPERTAAALLEEQNLELARALGALRDREAELARALEEARRSANEAAASALRLAEVGRRKDEILAVASHDIRSPVAAAKGALELLEPTLTELTEDQRHLLGVARRACDAVVHLVGNLLSSALMEVEDDDGPASDPRLDLAALAREVVELMAVEARRKAVQLELDAPAAPVPMRADLMWARQILANLVNNAVKYAPRGGHVWVRLAREAGRIVLTVDDDGVGIPREKAERVFERLTKLRPRGTAGERGSGIGLYVTKQLVERLGGTIGFSPREAKGTRFVVSLPDAEGAPREAIGERPRAAEATPA